MKNEFRKIKKSFLKNWLVIWLVVASVSLSALIASASFLDGLASMKRVVVATALGENMFSSDWMSENGILNKNRRRQRVEQLTAEQIASGNTYNVEVHVRNYDINTPKKHYSADITYDLVAKMTDVDGNELTSTEMGDKTVTVVSGNNRYTLDKNNLSTGITIFGESLISDENPVVTDQNTYRLEFSNDWDFERDANVYVQLEAVRTGASANYKDIADLGGFISIVKTDSSASSGWSGELKETGTPSNYDAYNFVLTGSGAAKITFEWDTEKITLNKYFYDSSLRNIVFDTGEVTYTPPTGSGEYGSWAKVVINANASTLRTDGKYRNRYEFQLYKVGVEEPSLSFVSISTTGTASKDGKWAACTIEKINQ